MKKTLVACVIGGLFASVAHAQSGTTIYGTLDVGYGLSNGGIYEGEAGRDSKFQQWGNGKSTSVWGIQGKEELSNEVSILFQLEAEIDPESGASADSYFNQAAFVGLESKFGLFQVGRQSTVSSQVLGEFDISGVPSLTSSLGNAGISGDSQRYRDDVYDILNSSLVYASPELSGFQMFAGFVTKNDDVFGLDDAAKNIYSVGALYNIGGLTLGAAVESKPERGVGASWGVGAKYDFESFAVAASYFDNHVKEDGRGYSLGVSVPVQAFEFGAQVAYNTGARMPDTAYADINQVLIDVGRDGVTKKVKPLAWELYGTYDLSKRTQLYMQYGGINNDAKHYNGATRKYSASMGMTHNF